MSSIDRAINVMQLSCLRGGRANFYFVILYPSYFCLKWISYMSFATHLAIAMLVWYFSTLAYAVNLLFWSLTALWSRRHSSKYRKVVMIHPRTAYIDFPVHVSWEKSSEKNKLYAFDSAIDSSWCHLSIALSMSCSWVVSVEVEQIFIL